MSVEPKTPEKKKQKASRELLALTGGKPQLTPTTTLFKEKRKLPTNEPPKTKVQIQQEKQKKEIVKKPTQKWEWKKIKSSSFPKSLQMYHWEKVTTQPIDYPFAKLNLLFPALYPTEEEFQQISNLDAGNWSMNETRELFGLCKKFDLRFTIVHDRFSNKTKSIEDLKKRYYMITKILQEMRIKHGRLMTPIYGTVFDHDGAVKRREQLEQTFNRTKEDEEKENELKEKLRKIEEIKKQRQLEAKKQKKKKEIEKIDLDAFIVDGFVSNMPDLNTLKPGIYCSLLLKGKAHENSNSRRIDSVLSENDLSIEPIPTEKILIEHEHLKYKISKLLDLQKKVLRKETSLEALIGKKETLMKSLESPPEKKRKF
eukprot:gene3828-6989_t